MVLILEKPSYITESLPHLAQFQYHFRSWVICKTDEQQTYLVALLKNNGSCKMSSQTMASRLNSAIFIHGALMQCKALCA